jgi:hypothetical protein
MEEEPSKDKLRCEAVEMVMEAVDLTEGLNQWTADSVEWWPRQQAWAAANALSESVDSSTLSAEDAEGMLGDRLDPVYRYVGAVRALARERKGLSRRQAYRRLKSIRDLAKELPSPPQVGPSKHMLTRFSALLPEADEPAYVRTIVIMLASMGGHLEDLRLGSGREYVFPRSG